MVQARLSWAILCRNIRLSATWPIFFTFIVLQPLVYLSTVYKSDMVEKLIRTMVDYSYNLAWGVLFVFYMTLVMVIPWRVVYARKEALKKEGYMECPNVLSIIMSPLALVPALMLLSSWFRRTAPWYLVVAFAWWAVIAFGLRNMWLMTFHRSEVDMEKTGHELEDNASDSLVDEKEA